MSSTDAFGWALAAVFGLLVLRHLLQRMKAPATEGFEDLFVQARELGFEGTAETGLTGRRDGVPIEIRLGSHRMSSSGEAGTTRYKMIQITWKRSGLGVWWLASPTLANRTRERLPEVGERRSAPTASMLICAPADEDGAPWCDDELLEECQRVGLQLALASDDQLVVKYSPFPPKGLDLTGRTEALLACTAKLGRTR